MSISFEVSETYPAPPETIYQAWLNSEAHTAMTGGEATASDALNGTFTAWDGYISGRNLALDPGQRIVQAWRTTAFVDDDGDSRLEIHLVPEGSNTKVILRHSDLPEDGMKYKQGWVDHYLDPMTNYFA